MRGPVVGITTAHNLELDCFFCRKTYVEAVIKKGGGVPLLLPPVQNETLLKIYVDLIDGLLLSGGGEIHPVYFGEEPHWKLEEVSPERDYFEVMLTRSVLEANKPILGICRGIQVLNVVLGGTLYQDLQTQLPNSLQHQQKAPRKYPTHKIKIRENSYLAQVLGTTILQVNSLHHQAIKDVAPGLQVVAWAEDGVVEAVESFSYPFVLGVQWHPEAMGEDNEHTASLFRAFVEAASEKNQMR